MDIIRREHKNVWKIPSAALNFKLDEAYQSEDVRERLIRESRLVSRIDGDYLNVVGLPGALLIEMLAAHAPNLLQVRS